jgi:hypothetical protein
MSEEWFGKIESDVWRFLVRGARDIMSPFHQPAFATRRAAGGAAVRTIVLRGTDPAQRTLWFYSDVETGKVADIAADPGVEIVFYDPGRQLQVRARGPADVLRHVDGDPLAVQAFSGVSERAWSDFGGADAPARFAVVRLRVEAFDVLQLRRGGVRRRAGITYGADGVPVVVRLPA